jgi:hypothetical protein
MRAISVWMLFVILADMTKEDDDGRKTILAFGFFFWVSVWFAVLYYIANLWTTYVDPFCARMTQRLEKYVFEEEEEEKSILL